MDLQKGLPYKIDRIPVVSYREDILYYLPKIILNQIKQAHFDLIYRKLYKQRQPITTKK